MTGKPATISTAR